MTITKTEEFVEADRYVYDQMLFKQNFATIDTEQDAPWYGNWACPKRRVIFTYCEGDCYTIECDTDEEFVSEIKRIIEWHKTQSKFYGIDPGLKHEHQTNWIDMGLGDYLH